MPKSELSRWSYANERILNDFVLIFFVSVTNAAEGFCFVFELGSCWKQKTRVQETCLGRTTFFHRCFNLDILHSWCNVPEKGAAASASADRRKRIKLFLPFRSAPFTAHQSPFTACSSNRKGQNLSSLPLRSALLSLPVLAGTLDNSSRQFDRATGETLQLCWTNHCCERLR